MTATIEVRALDTGASRRISFTVARGESYALLGPLGSGKTTLLETLAGRRRPAAGSVRVRGRDPYAGADPVRVGAVWRDGGLFPGLTVAETVDAWRRWTLDPITRDEALCLAGLTHRAGTRFERLGAGERRRLDLALALVNRSDVLFLDEPTAGLTAWAADEVWAMLRRLTRSGGTVLLTTRAPAEARRADRSLALGAAPAAVRDRAA